MKLTPLNRCLLDDRSHSHRGASLESSPVGATGLAAAALSFALLLAACAAAPPPDNGGLGPPIGGSSVACENPGPSGNGGASGFTAPPARDLPWLHVEGNQIKDPSGDTVILRGVAFADLGEVERQEGGINAMIDRVTNAGDVQSCSASWETRVIRVAVSPADGGVLTPVQYQPGGNYIDTILRPTVDYARSRGLYVIIDWHYIGDTTLHQQSTAAFWADIAPHFAGDSNVLFELYNEPVNGGNWASVRADMQSWTNIVRAAAPDNLILVGTPNWCQNVSAATMNPVDGANLVYVAHMYPEHFNSPSLRTELSTAAAVKPVIVTEWGFQQGGNTILNGNVTNYGGPFKQFLENQKVSWTGWCASRSWQPAMFRTDFVLKVGEGSLGGFVKDWLYEKRAADQPTP